MIWRCKTTNFFTLILLNLFISLVYGDFFGTDSPPSIRQDVVFINGTDINSIDYMMPTMNYNDNIIPTDGTPDPPSDGVAGILYDRGLSCSPANITSGFQYPPYNLRPDVPKIALILRGECKFSTKLQFASEDPGIVAAIVYDNISFANDSTGIDGISIMGSVITFPVFYVDWSLGISMQAMINSLASGNMTTQNTNGTLRGVRITLYPGSSQSYPAVWEFTLLLVVILLAISFVASLCMHCHLYRNRRRRNILHRDSAINMVPIQTKPVIRREVLETFPVTIFGGQQPAIIPSDITNDEDVSSKSIILVDQQPTVPANLTRTASIRSARSNRAVENAQALASRDRRISVDPTSRSDGNIAPDLRETVCAICLSEFEHGDMVRTLPCHHEYHVECIDPWLLSRSSECPLCKHDCSPTLPR